MKTRDRIILMSIDMFNRSGVVAVTTNHIAKELNISPGNLYFHFSNKEEIIREIFRQMSEETYKIWKTKKTVGLIHPLVLVEKNFEMYWKYRFFHREMHYLRRKDPILAKMWRSHIERVLRLMTLMYKRWLKEDWMTPIRDSGEIQFLVDVLLATASSFLQFFESAEKLPARNHIDNGRKYVARILVHYTQGSMRDEFLEFIES